MTNPNDDIINTVRVSSLKNFPTVCENVCVCELMDDGIMGYKVPVIQTMSLNVLTVLI